LQSQNQQETTVKTKEVKVTTEKPKPITQQPVTVKTKDVQDTKQDIKFPAFDEDSKGSFVKVINQAPYPQVVIIPHQSNNPNKFSLTLGDQVIGFDGDSNNVNRMGKLPDESKSLVNQQLILKESGQQTNGSAGQSVDESRHQRLANSSALDDDDFVLPAHPQELGNEARKEALMRASEKQSLLLENLMDAVERHRLELKNSSKPEDKSKVQQMEQVIHKQMLAVNDFRQTIAQSGVDGNEEFTSERLAVLEDASHRQLEVLESLIEAVEKLNAGNSGANTRCRFYEIL
jgi:hypothetical protein